MGASSNFFISLIIAFIFNVLERVKTGLFIEFCKVANKAIAEAEVAWYGQTGVGALKKEWVLDHVMGWVDATIKLNWIQRMIFKSTMSIFVDSLVTEINDALGKDWVEKAKELEVKIGLSLGIDNPEMLLDPLGGSPEAPRAPGAGAVTTG